jgi:glycosyltransferase involved in cell wall biosynthesis
MTFFFDCRFIQVDHHDGISRFSSELYSAISRNNQATALVSDLEQLKLLPPDIEYLLVNDPKNPWRELWLPRHLHKQGASVVFSPMQTMGSVGKRYKLILTLHDLIYYKHRKPPRSLAWPIRLTWRLFHLSFWPVRVLLNRADAVVTISQTTKDLIERNRLTKRSVKVVYNASSMTAVDKPKVQPKSKDLVYMGSFMPYKNVETLIRAVEQLPEYTLTLCSKVDLKRKEQLLSGLSVETISRIRFANGVTESKYMEIIDESFALVSASKDEGFGIPLIEAMSRSIPVIVSDIPIFHEVAAEAGQFFNPEDSAELVRAIRKLEQNSVWQSASSLSLQRSKLFNWDQSAAELMRVVESLRQ